MEDENMRIVENMIYKNGVNFKKLNDLKKIICILDPIDISNSFKTHDVDAMIENLKDGRSGSWWLESTISDAYNLTHSKDKNGLYDASIENINSTLVSQIRIGIKTLSKNGVDLRQSGFKGRGFKSINDELKRIALSSSIYLSDYHIIVDTIDAPTLFFNPIKSLEIMYFLNNEKFPLVLNRDVFYKTFYEKSLDELLINNEYKNYVFIPITKTLKE